MAVRHFVGTVTTVCTVGAGVLMAPYVHLPASTVARAAGLIGCRMDGSEPIESPDPVGQA